MDSTKEINSSEPPSKKAKLATDNQNIDHLNFKPTPQIDLSPAEELLRNLLLDCRDYVASSPVPAPAKDTTPAGEMWFVGGWVRDKLLGKQSCDIDVAISGMTGAEFARELKKFLSSDYPATTTSDEEARPTTTTTTTKEENYKARATQAGIPAEIRGFYDIDRNPKKGKHLQTSSAKIFGLEIDFVNLRAERDFQVDDSGGGSSRPSFGESEKRVFDSLAEEDAYRRDATVNAIFYNLDSQRVEDHTLKGLEDLAAGVLRTPLDARVTFTDDPLRILRFVRLAGSLGFTIDEGNTQCAIRDPGIQRLIGTGISPERIGLELKKMITGLDPASAFLWIHRLKLYKPVVLGQQPKEILDRLRESADSEARKADSSDTSEYVWPLAWPDACKTVSELLSTDNGELVAVELARSQDVELVWQMALWCPLALLHQPEDTRPSPVVKPATQAIKSTNEMAKLLENSLGNLHDIRSTVDQFVNNNDKANLRRSTVGMTLRSWGKTWKLQVLFALLADIISGRSEKDNIQSRYSTFLQSVINLNLQEVHSTLQILNGGDIKTIFQLRRSGPFMNGVLKAALEWQLDHEAEHDSRDEMKEQAISWLRGQKEALMIPDPDGS